MFRTANIHGPPPQPSRSVCAPPFARAAGNAILPSWSWGRVLCRPLAEQLLHGRGKLQVACGEGKRDGGLLAVAAMQQGKA